MLWAHVIADDDIPNAHVLWAHVISDDDIPNAHVNCHSMHLVQLARRHCSDF